MDITGWVRDWQMQWCGEPFAVNSEVMWKVAELEERSPLLGAT